MPETLITNPSVSRGMLNKLFCPSSYHRLARVASLLVLGTVLLFLNVDSAGTSYGQGNRGRTRIQSELITIRPNGFEPTQINRRQGRVFLFVDNRSGLEAVTLRLDRVGGNRLHNVRIPREILDWGELLNLTPGTYTLTEADHSEWICTITVTAQ